MNKQQTALQWLEHQLNLTGKTHFFSLRELIEQAKQMEKEQIKEAYEFGTGDAYNYNDDEGEQYYNETYGNEK
jgi:hypothetical protein